MAARQNDDVDYCMGQVRRHDHDRYLMALLAPAEARDDFFSVLAFNLEVAKTAEVVSEPMLGQIRLQWWREAIDDAFTGAPRAHAVLDGLRPAIHRRNLSQGHFQNLIEAREEDLTQEPLEDMAALERYSEKSSSALVWLMLEILDCREGVAQEAARHLGVAWGMAGLMRALPYSLGSRRPILPADLREGASDDGRPNHLQEAVRTVARRAEWHLARARDLRDHVSHKALPALMAGPLTDHYLKALARASYDPAKPEVQNADRLNAWRLALARLRKRY